MIELVCLLSGDIRRGLTDVFSYGRDDVFRLPVVIGVPGENLAVFANKDGGERMREGFVVARRNPYVEELGDGREIFFCRRGKVPVEKFFVGVVAGVGATVTAKDLWRVVGGIEADGDEMSLLVERRIGGEGLVDVGEVARHARAEVSELAAGVDEGEENELALELIEMDGAVALVEQVEVGYGVAGRRDVIGDGRFVVGAGLGDDDDVIELDVGVFVADFVCEDRCGDAIAGMKFAGDARVLEFAVHGHGFHETGDVFAVEGHATVARRDDFAADGEGFLRGR